MKQYKYESFYHFVNSFKKVIRNHLRVNITITPEYGDKLKAIYDLYENNRELLSENKIKYPTDVFISHIYNFKEWSSYIESSFKLLNDLAKHYSEIYSDNESAIEFLKLNYYAPSRLEQQFEKYEDQYDEADQFSDETKSKLLSVEGKSGVYRLYDKNKKLIYIGKSVDLGSRIGTSRRERKAMYFSVATTCNGLDASIYEAYYIGKEQPPLNSDLIGIGEPTIELEDLDFGEIIRFCKRGLEE